jgi:hypothetical protein
LRTEVNLIIAPLNTLKGWRNTVKEQGVTLPFHQIIDSSVAGKQHWEDLKNHVPGIYFIGREFFALSGTELEPEPKLKPGSQEAQEEPPGRVRAGRER